MTLKFTKMHGLGNDFMVVDATAIPFDFGPQQIRRWADRNFGIGFDQLLVVEPPSQAGVEFRYRIFNADGSEVQQCGNGARCFARFVYDKGLTQNKEIVVETASGVIVLYIEDNGWVRVNMGEPNFDPQVLPFEQALQEKYPLQTPVGEVEIGAVSMGNPHAVLLVDEVETAQVEVIGPFLESHPLFPERVNVGFAECVDRQHVRLRVYERGSAETLACGTGACAAMAVLHQWNLVDDQVLISLPGGDLQIVWNGPGGPLWMTGPAETVFEGEIEV
ncbi:MULTISPECIES: diaminopimelate epimerase [Thiomicrorhabdus]|uniref:Diaminopimelate epimerase n=1 Tax=Thiomicrorhabdus heinhorstiae TaxID=2748010 RepID=A0ABS0BY80_9GAMM|nr:MULTISPECIES: diaminopimelate epimerase [Thiomicrorhabdus]MBF6057959.1 diaminopimelate epimerase [Thiomicrorhabdus heinhorstiae]